MMTTGHRSLSSVTLWKRTICCGTVMLQIESSCQWQHVQAMVFWQTRVKNVNTMPALQLCCLSDWNKKWSQSKWHHDKCCSHITRMFQCARWCLGLRKVAKHTNASLAVLVFFAPLRSSAFTALLICAQRAVWCSSRNDVSLHVMGEACE